MRKVLTEICIIAIPAFLISILFFQVLTVRKTIDENNQLKQKVDYLNQEIGLYENNEEWFEDYIELIEEIYEREIEIKVLEERVYWLNKYKETSEFNKEYADQMFNDLEDFLIIVIDYIEIHGNLNNFNDYFLSYHRELYGRINTYDENY